MQSKQSCLRERDVQRTISADRRSRGAGRALCRITLLGERRQVVGRRSVRLGEVSQCIVSD